MAGGKEAEIRQVWVKKLTVEGAACFRVPSFFSSMVCFLFQRKGAATGDEFF